MSEKCVRRCDITASWGEFVDRELQLRSQLHDDGDKRTCRLMTDWRSTAVDLFELFKQQAFTIPWSELCSREDYLRSRILMGPFSDSKPDAEILRKWWGAVETLMDVYQRELAKSGFAPTAAEARSVQIPFGLAMFLKQQFGYLAAGLVPEPIKDVTKGERGRRSKGPAERRDIGWAVAYHRACAPKGVEHAGKVVRITNDRHPVKTLAGWYSVDKRTVQGWVRNEEPAWLGLSEINADILISRTQQAGGRYSVAGRSNKAIESRGTKRT